ncbi:hypothetical protein ABI59_17190 [Acidobacteria bacterium Mor1]|nr:hypothetical protein ABI59_17190 [Acidobacteria bacterium Mor1]
MVSSRTLVAFAVIATACPAVFAAAESLTEAACLERFRAESPDARRIALIERAGDLAATAAGRPDDPTLSYQREDALGARDEFLSVAQPLPLTGRRRLVRSSVAAASTAERYAARRDLADREAALRRAFQRVLHQEAMLELHREGLARLEELVRVLAERERAGEGSGYDLLRVEQEHAAVQIAAGRIEGEVASARARFGSFFAAEQEMARQVLVEGPKQPRPTPSDEEALAAAFARRSDLAAAKARRERFDLDRRAAVRSRVPEPELQAGLKRSESDGARDTGFFAAVSLPLRISGRGKLEAARAASRRDRAELEIEVLERNVRAEVLEALSRERAARGVWQRGRQSIARAEQLRSIAELAYREGEGRVLDLLDAYRSTLEAEVSARELRFEAKLAELETDRVMESEVSP